MDSEKLNMVAKWLSVSGESHPWTVMRAQQVLNWIDSGGYEAVLNMPLASAAAAGSTGGAKFCIQCGWQMRGSEKFCAGCGRAVA